MSESPTCAKCGEEYSLPFDYEPTKYCDLCAHGVAQALEEENAQLKNEIAALQRRLTEYAAEVERLKELGRDCYVDANDKSTLNALEECRQERDKLKEGAKRLAKTVQHYAHWEHPPLGSKTAHQALVIAQELGLLEEDK